MSRYYLQQIYIILNAAGSNAAVQVNAERLLRVLQANNEDTSGILRVMPDVLESICSRWSHMTAMLRY